MSMQETDLLIALGSRFDDRVTGKVPELRAATPRSSTSTSTRPSSARSAGPTCRSSATAGSSSRSSSRPSAGAAREGRPRQPDRHRLALHALGLAGAVPAGLRAAGGGRACSSRRWCSRPCATPRPRTRSSARGVGQHQMWASQYWKFRHPYTWINSGGLGTMGFSVPGGHRRQGRPAGPHGLGGRRRRLLPDDRAGAGHRGGRAHPGQDRHPEQRLPRHGPPVAGDVLRRAVLRGVPVARPARLREVGRGHGLRGVPRRAARRHPAHDRQGQRHRRPPGRHRVPHRCAEKVFPMVAAGHSQLRCPGPRRSSRHAATDEGSH